MDCPGAVFILMLILFPHEVLPGRRNGSCTLVTSGESSPHFNLKTKSSDLAVEERWS